MSKLAYVCCAKYHRAHKRPISAKARAICIGSYYVSSRLKYALTASQTDYLLFFILSSLESLEPSGITLPIYFPVKSPLLKENKLIVAHFR